jgi:hypothetical protein
MIRSYYDHQYPVFTKSGTDTTPDAALLEFDCTAQLRDQNAHAEPSDPEDGNKKKRCAADILPVYLPIKDRLVNAREMIMAYGQVRLFANLEELAKVKMAPYPAFKQCVTFKDYCNVYHGIHVMTAKERAAVAVFCYEILTRTIMLTICAQVLTKCGLEYIQILIGSGKKELPSKARRDGFVMGILTRLKNTLIMTPWK